MTYSRLARHLGPGKRTDLARMVLMAEEILEEQDAVAKTVHTQAKPDPVWEQAVLRNANGICEHVDHGNRCPVAKGLKAVSFKPGSKDPAHGAALCPHHATTDT